ncbi:hypothetical protein [Facklamia sp. P12950]|uniref:hypothetical protein n=1 Tax=unclassified Facklamia TaxID=2622293 RepID=UPI003D16A778
MEYQWNGLANLLADLIGKYAEDLDVNNLPNPLPITSDNEDEIKDINFTKLSQEKGFK